VIVVASVAPLSLLLLSLLLLLLLLLPCVALGVVALAQQFVAVVVVWLHHQFHPTWDDHVWQASSLMIC
jgi:hypothetical protein